MHSIKIVNADRVRQMNGQNQVQDIRWLGMSQMLSNHATDKIYNQSHKDKDQVACISGDVIKEGKGHGCPSYCLDLPWNISGSWQKGVHPYGFIGQQS